MSARCARSGDGSVCILAVGKMLTAAESAADELEAEGIEATVWDVRVVSDPDPAMLAERRRPPGGGHRRGRRPLRRGGHVPGRRPRATLWPTVPPLRSSRWALPAPTSPRASPTASWPSSAWTDPDWPGRCGRRQRPFPRPIPLERPDHPGAVPTGHRGRPSAAALKGIGKGIEGQLCPVCRVNRNVFY